jgi:hypothetical protein
MPRIRVHLFVLPKLPHFEVQLTFGILIINLAPKRLVNCSSPISPSRPTQKARERSVDIAFFSPPSFFIPNTPHLPCFASLRRSVCGFVHVLSLQLTSESPPIVYQVGPICPCAGGTTPRCVELSQIKITGS